jgi:hypothetical protein
MHRKPLWTLAVTILAAVMVSGPQTGQARESDDVGLGVAIGTSVPMSTSAVKTGVSGMSLDWGFFVDIPLISTFYISPSAMIYDLKIPDALQVEGMPTKWSVTDIDLNFKFIVPISKLSLQAGVLAGLTTGADLGNLYTPHAGLVVAVAYNLVSNLDAFVLANYKILFNNNSNVKTLHAYAGLMINL